MICVIPQPLALVAVKVTSLPTGILVTLFPLTVPKLLVTVMIPFDVKFTL